jgi:DNA processing protein
MNNNIVINDKDYPKSLKKIGRDAPKQLHYKGEWNDEIFKNCLAVVGSRRMTTYGKQVTERIVSEAAAAGITIVSGFMYGVDATAHKAALNARGKTIAVMPCGIDLIHPEYQQDLYKEILDNNGLVISEYEGAMQPSNWTYPRRNRIVAGLSKAVLVIEAGEKSGSLITANFAKKFKRKLFVIPGPITSENTKGIMELLKQGATPISSAENILDYYKIKFQIPNSKLQTNSKSEISNSKITIEQKIIDQLKRESLEIDALARAFAVPVSKIGVTLSMMQLRGLIRQAGPKYYIN